MMKVKTITSWVLRIVAALILLQTLYFKFTGQPESIYIFSTLHMEPWGRIGSGIAELMAAILMLLSRTVVLGALVAVGVMVGALVAHLTLLGIEVQNDNGLLFVLCLIVLCSGLILLLLHRGQLKSYLSLLKGQKVPVSSKS